MTHFTTPDLFDQHGEAVCVLDPVFRDFGGRIRFAGPATTVKCFEDNSRIKEALAEPGNGRVLVVDAGGSLRCAMLGDLIAASAVEQGWAENVSGRWRLTTSGWLRLDEIATVLTTSPEGG